MAAVIAAALGSFLWPLLFYMNYATGRILRGPNHQADVPKAIEEVEFTETLTFLERLGKLGVDFFLGSTVNSILSMVIGYFLFRYLFQKLRPTVLKRLRKH